jgi:hypothetical protein
MNKIFIFYCSFILLISCNTISTKNKSVIHHDKWSSYVLNNESALNADLDRAIVEYKKMFPEDSNYRSNTRVFLSHDTTLNDPNFKNYPHLGQFSAYINEINECILISYTFQKDTSQRKIITLFKDNSRPCMVNLDSVLSSVDTTEHFIVIKGREPTIADFIEIGNQSIQVRNLRFLIRKRDSIHDIEIFLNPDSSNFTLTKEIIKELPAVLFEKEFFDNKIGQVSLQLKSGDEYGLLTINQLHKILLGH